MLKPPLMPTWEHAVTFVGDHCSLLRPVPCEEVHLAQAGDDVKRRPAVERAQQHTRRDGIHRLARERACQLSGVLTVHPACAGRDR